MKQISFWANQHRGLAIFFIVVLKTVMGITAFYLGQWLAEDGLLISSITVYFMAAVFLLTTYVYPGFKKHYQYRKTADWVMMSCAFITVVTISNNINALKVTTPLVQAAYNINPQGYQTASFSKKEVKNNLSRMEKKELRRALLKQGKIMSALMLEVDPNAKKRTTIIVLTVLLAIITGFFLSGLVCSLSCNGSDVAAVLVLVFGVAGIIWGSVALIKSANRKYPKATPAPSTPLPNDQ